MTSKYLAICNYNSYIKLFFFKILILLYILFNWLESFSAIYNFLSIYIYITKLCINFQILIKDNLDLLSRARSELFTGFIENTGKCLEVTMIGFVPVDSPNCPGAGDGRNL